MKHRRCCQLSQSMASSDETIERNVYMIFCIYLCRNNVTHGEGKARLDALNYSRI